MKLFLIGLLTLTSLSSFAAPECSFKINKKESRGKVLNTAKEVLLAKGCEETNITSKANVRITGSSVYLSAFHKCFIQLEGSVNGEYFDLRFRATDLTGVFGLCVTDKDALDELSVEFKEVLDSKL